MPRVAATLRSKHDVDFRPVHALEAREAYMRAVHDAGFIESLAAFARDHTPPKFILRDAEPASPRYAEELSAFTATWGLDAAWFREFCHDAAWATTAASPGDVTAIPFLRPSRVWTSRSSGLGTGWARLPARSAPSGSRSGRSRR